MCGICGVVGVLHDDDQARVAEMTQRLVHRGPDAGGTWCSCELHDGPPADGVAFGHRRLAIIDLQPASNQPMVDPSTGNVVVFNGEIYNYRELASELRGRGVAFRTQSDTEVLLKAYEAWGEEGVERFRGMFAFAIWNPRERHVFLARDHVGVKPLYYAEEPSSQGMRFLFASEARTLIHALASNPRLDATALRTYVWHGFVADNRSIVSGIRLLEPGTTLTVSESGQILRRRRYWSLPLAPEDRTSDASALSEALEEAVSLRLISDAPLGVFLSGGIDSSAVASLAARRTAGQLQTFNLAFDEERFDESGYAAEIARIIGSDHHTIRLREADFLSQLDDALASIDQPTFDAINSYFISRAVKEAGVTVALAGTGGDELFGGYRSFRDVPRIARMLTKGQLGPGPVRNAAAWCMTRALTLKSNGVPPQTKWGKVPDLLRRARNVVDVYQYSYSIFTDAMQESLLEDADGSPLAFGLPRGRYDDLLARLADQPHLHAVSVCELESFIRHRLLRDTDAASMAVALEARVPLLDYRVIEAAARLSDERRFLPIGEKRLLQELALCPEAREIVSRPKSGFVLPLDVWCRSALRSRVEAALTDQDLCVACGLNPQLVAAIWKAFINGSRGMYWSRVWSLYVLISWCDRHGARVAAT